LYCIILPVTEAWETENARCIEDGVAPVKPLVGSMILPVSAHTAWSGDYLLCDPVAYSMLVS
jgi:hypothetical protein